ncbi:MAG: hypothetical protein AB7I32_07275 [Gammaproteobacteria bacterium]
MRRLLALTMVCSAALAGCDRDAGPADEGTLESAAVVVQDAELDSLRSTGFLQLIDGDVAALWLALQAQAPGEQTRPADAVVAQYEAMIRELATRLLEDRRMIANRTVQTRDELADHGIQVTVDELITGLLEVARAGVVGNYGSYCDYYINLRQRPLAHAAALAEMRSLRVLAPAGAP